MSSKTPLEIIQITSQLPEKMRQSFSSEFQVLFVALCCYGWSVGNIVEGKRRLTKKDILSEDYGEPFAIVESAVMRPLYEGSSVPIYEHEDYERLFKEARVENLHIQEELLVLLDKFYMSRAPQSPLARLAVRIFRGGNECILEPQGANVRELKDKAERERLYDDFWAEMSAFGEFLARDVVSKGLHNKTTPA